jgi:hypothetical protein
MEYVHGLMDRVHGRADPWAHGSHKTRATHLAMKGSDSSSKGV